jgi:hypothetical protein
MLLIVMGLVPLILWGATLYFYRAEGRTLVRWRKAIFLAGIVANAVSAAVLLSFLVRAYIGSHGTTSMDLDRAYPVVSMLGLGVLSAMLASSGRRVSRLLLIGDGLITAVFWYLAAMGASA